MPREYRGGRAGKLDRGIRRGLEGQPVGRRQFEKLVAEALATLPRPFLARLENVAVLVEEQPSPELLASLGMSRHETLLGLYDGVPLTQRGEWYNWTVPDRIIIYRRPIMSICASAREIREQVRQTVIHEVAHFYGIDDDELDRMGFS